MRIQEGTKITITPDEGEEVTFSGGFHGAEISVPYDRIESYISRSGLRVVLTWISERSFAQANRAFCGMKDCTCGSGLRAVDQAGGLVAVETLPDEFKGDGYDLLLPDEEEKTDRRLLVSLTEGLDSALREEAHKLKISLAEAVRRALEAWLKREEEGK